MTKSSRKLIRFILISLCFVPCIVTAAETSQISMAQQLSPGELVFVILTKRADGKTFSSVVGMGKLDFRQVKRLPASKFEEIREHFDDGSLSEYQDDGNAELNMADPAFYTLSVADSNRPDTVYRVPIDDHDRGMEVVELFSELVPDDYRLRLNENIEP